MRSTAPVSHRNVGNRGSFISFYKSDLDLCAAKVSRFHLFQADADGLHSLLRQAADDRLAGSNALGEILDFIIVGIFRRKVDLIGGLTLGEGCEGIVGKERYPVTLKATEVIRTLVMRGIDRLKNLFRGNRSRSEIVATFLAILELCKTNTVRLEDDNSGENPNVRLINTPADEEGENA